MTIVEKHVGTCPVCGQKSMVSHCGDEHPTCDWKLCRNKDCEAVIDPMRKIGHAKVPGTTEGRRRVDLDGGPA